MQGKHKSRDQLTEYYRYYVGTLNLANVAEG